MPPIVLASASPRRIELLSQVGLDPVVMAPEVDETPLRRESPRAMVARLARAKAEAAVPRALRRFSKAVVIAADTTVVAPDGRRILGKPRDRADASRMLALLSGRTHTVLTGYCVLSVSRGGSAARFVRVVRSRVTLRKLGRRDIERYLRTGEPFDKAGSYAAQGMGMALIERIQGSYANVVGLPVAQLLRDLEERLGLGLFPTRAGGRSRRNG
jgi:septum formation protein